MIVRTLEKDLKLAPHHISGSLCVFFWPWSPWALGSYFFFFVFFLRIAILPFLSNPKLTHSGLALRAQAPAARVLCLMGIVLGSCSGVRMGYFRSSEPQY